MRQSFGKVVEMNNFREFQKFCGIILLVTLFVAGNVSDANAAAGSTYAGLEFYGSSQMTRTEVEKMVHLRPGASEKSVESAAESLRARFEKLRLAANVQIASVAPDKLYLVVDFESAPGAGVPTRILKNPHHVLTKSEKPDILLQKLRARIERLNEEGREWTDSYPGGVRMFSDEPANQIVLDLRRFGPAMRDDWLEIVASDPDKRLRCDAIELLNWAPNTADTCAQLIPALDDSHYEVRAAAEEFIFPRLDILPSNFPFNQLAMSLVRQLKRPSHSDRSRSMAFIRALIARYPQMAVPFRRTSEQDLERFSRDSQIPTIRKAADDLLVILRAPLPPGEATEIPQAGF